MKHLHTLLMFFQPKQKFVTFHFQDDVACATLYTIQCDKIFSTQSGYQIMSLQYLEMRACCVCCIKGVGVGFSNSGMQDTTYTRRPPIMMAAFWESGAICHQ